MDPLAGETRGARDSQADSSSLYYRPPITVSLSVASGSSEADSDFKRIDYLRLSGKSQHLTHSGETLNASPRPRSASSLFLLGEQLGRRDAFQQLLPHAVQGVMEHNMNNCRDGTECKSVMR